MGKRPEPRYSDLAAARRRFCPFCEDLLEDLVVDGSVPVQQCPACSAIWLNRNDLGRIRRRAGLAGFDEDRLRSLPLPGARLVCPRCDIRKLRKILTPAGVLHRCRECRGFMTRDVERGLRPLLISAPMIRTEDGSLELEKHENTAVRVLTVLYFLAIFAVAGAWHVWFGS